MNKFGKADGNGTFVQDYHPYNDKAGIIWQTEKRDTKQMPRLRKVHAQERVTK